MRRLRATERAKSLLNGVDPEFVDETSRLRYLREAVDYGLSFEQPEMNDLRALARLALQHG
jgi:hypothetical protein